MCFRVIIVCLSYRLDWLQISFFFNQDGRVVKALDLSSNGRMSAWVRTPLLVNSFLLRASLFIAHSNRKVRAYHLETVCAARCEENLSQARKYRKTDLR